MVMMISPLVRRLQSRCPSTSRPSCNATTHTHTLYTGP